MRLAGILMVGNNAGLEVLDPVPSFHSLGLSDMSARRKSKSTHLIAADLIGVPLRPGHHQKAETAAQGQAQDERQGRSEDGKERGQAHG